MSEPTTFYRCSVCSERRQTDLRKPTVILLRSPRHGALVSTRVSVLRISLIDCESRSASELVCLTCSRVGGRRCDGEFCAVDRVRCARWCRGSRPPALRLPFSGAEQGRSPRGQGSAVLACTRAPSHHRKARGELLPKSHKSSKDSEERAWKRIRVRVRRGQYGSTEVQRPSSESSEFISSAAPFFPRRTAPWTKTSSSGTGTFR